MERKNGRIKKLRKAARALAWLFLLAGVSRTVSGRVWSCLFLAPYRLEADCAGGGVDVGQIRQWEEWAKRGAQGVTDIAGWRIEGERDVASDSTGRKRKARILGVYGNMDLVFPVETLSGSYGLTGREGSCVLSEGLADALFGSVDVVGERVCYQGANQENGGWERGLIVAGVIKKEGEYLLIHVEEGGIDALAVEFSMGFQAREKMESYLPSFGEPSH